MKSWTLTALPSYCRTQDCPIRDVGYTNYARDGITIMQDRSLFDFFVRSLLLLCFYLCSQLPKSLGVEIDKRQFLEAFTRK